MSDSTRISSISPMAVIHPTAKIAENVEIGPWAMIGEQVEIGAGSRVLSHAIVYKNTVMGKNNVIYPHAVVGGDSQDLKYHGEEAWLKMGDNNIVREFATINRGSDGVTNTTTVGSHNAFCSYSHVAHDSIIGNHVLFVSYGGVAGHVTVHDHAVIGAYCAVHQFTQIGAHAFLANATMVKNDIPPFMMVTGTPGVPVGLNLVGLRRHGFSAAAIGGIKKAYRLMYRDCLPMKELEEALAALAKETPEVQMIIDLMKSSERGIVRKQATPAKED